QILGVADRLGDELNIHRRLARLPRTLTINAVLAHQHERVGQHVERHSEPPARHAHHEFVFFELFAPLFVNAHVTILRCARSTEDSMWGRFSEGLAIFGNFASPSTSRPQDTIPPHMPTGTRSWLYAVPRP